MEPPASLWLTVPCRCRALFLLWEHFFDSSIDAIFRFARCHYIRMEKVRKLAGDICTSTIGGHETMSQGSKSLPIVLDIGVASK